MKKRENEKKSSELEALFTEIRDRRRQAETNIGGVKRAFIAGAEMAKAQAQQALPALRERLARLTIPERLVGVVPVETSEAVVVKLSRFLTANSGVSVVVDSLWREAADDLEPGMSPDRHWRTTQHGRLAQFLATRAQLLGLVERWPEWREFGVCTKAEIPRVVRDLAVSAYGPNFLAVDLRDRIMRQVEAGELSGRVPVLLVGGESDISYVKGLFSRVVEHRFDADFEPTYDSVSAVFGGKKKSVDSE